MNKSKNRRPKTEDRRPIFAKKSFGQNFLVDQSCIDKIISALNPQSGETIIEIGAGRGALTENLLESGANVIAIEIERDMIAVLRQRFSERKNFTLIEQDALKIDFLELTTNNEQRTTNKLVANLPYYISTAILQRLIEQRNCFSEMFLMFQREVVQRITAQAGDSERGFLTVLTEAYLETEKLFDVPTTAFRPAPKVWSAVVRLKPKDNVEIENENLFKGIISAGFVQKRKTIFNNLKNVSGNLAERFANRGGVLEVLENLNVEKNRRAETMTLDEWTSLSNFLS